jgi:hypothetical protein
MSNDFWIKHKVEQVNCLIPRDSNPDYEGFMLNAMIGEAVIGSGEQSISTGKCSLLCLSRSLIRLCTFPVLYGTEAFESVMETSIDLRSRFNGGNLVISVQDGRVQVLTFHVPLVAALQKVGSFHHSLLMSLFQSCPVLRDYGALLVGIPDAFAIEQMVRARERAGPGKF